MKILKLIPEVDQHQKVKLENNSLIIQQRKSHCHLILLKMEVLIKIQ